MHVTSNARSAFRFFCRAIPFAAPALAATLTGGSAAIARPAVDFNREVRPILSANCLKCHGIDDGSRKGKLRLDVRETATAPAKSGERAIVPGKPDESELVRRILTTDEDDVMPPPSQRAVLTDAQKQTLKQWIAEGANYATHWAFVPPVQAGLPAVKLASWSRNPIDVFVFARLEAEGLHPSPEADRYVLVRRVFLDLIGLPPTPAEADAFVNDASPDAYEKLVDRLLASPHYGERWARRWLDLARYADTNGFEKDRLRSIWPWRDWVINAMNADMPFDEFTIDQIAGDMLPNATRDQRIATGFHRNTMLNEEGGIDPLEYRFHSMVDRVGATGTTWLGLTVRCAQCHTHKYDPITQKDYYRLMAVLNNADEPEMEIPSPALEAKRQEIEAKIAKLTADLPEQFAAGGDNLWETPTAAVRTTGGSKPEAAGDGSWRFTGPPVDRDSYTIEFDSDLSNVDRIRLETLKDGEIGPGRTPHGNFVLSRITVTVAPKEAPASAQPVRFARAQADASQAGFPVESAIDGKAGSGWAVDAHPGKAIGPRTATFYLEKPAAFPHGAHWTIKLDQDYGRHHTIARMRLSVGSAASGRKSPAQRHDALDRAYAAWEKSASAGAVQWTTLRPAEMHSSMPILTALPDDSVLASGDITKSDTYDLLFHTDLHGITAVRLEALPHESLPHHGPGMAFYEGTKGDFFLSEIALQADGKPAKFASAVASFSPAKFAIANTIDGDQQTGWSIGGKEGQAHVAVFILAEPVAQTRDLKLHLLFERYFAAALGHFRISVTTDPRVLHSTALPPDVEAALATPQDARSAAERDRLMQYFLSVAPEVAEARKEIDRLRGSLPKEPTTLVMKERSAGHTRPTHLHHRGEFLQPEDAMEPGVPGFLPPLPAGVTVDRLAFARWLVSPQNPLTARVTVNRQWQGFFGRGIVRTMEDFGYQGEMPSHPELLDWLSIEFMKQGWSVKKLHRLIVTSATYRQSSRVSPELLARDPQNVLLARGPRFRGDAEVVRDAALRASGLLSEKIGGPSVFPPQPSSVTTEGTYGALPWFANTGEDRFRRSLYTFSKRTAPFALYNTFDGPTGEECIARREVSDTPLQALSLLNDTVFVEAFQAMGREFGAMKQADEARAEAMFRRCLTRPPEGEELKMIVAFAAAERQRFAGNQAAAAKVAGSAGPDAVERATWTAVARALLNLDEAVTKD